MQAKPLAFTIIAFALLAFLADSWLARSGNSAAVFEQSQVAPIAQQASPLVADTVEVDPSPARAQIEAADSLEMTLSVAQKLQDLTLIARIEKKFFRVKNLRRAKIDVASENGDVTLRGSVSSNNEQTRALRLAQSVSGVQSVNNQLKVLEVPATSGSDSE